MILLAFSLCKVLLCAWSCPGPQAVSFGEDSGSETLPPHGGSEETKAPASETSRCMRIQEFSLFSQNTRVRWPLKWLGYAKLVFQGHQGQVGHLLTLWLCPCMVVVQRARSAGSGAENSQGLLSRSSSAKAGVVKAVWGDGGRAVATTSDSVHEDRTLSY